MGRSSKPLRLCVEREWLQDPILIALAEQGHEIIPLEIEADMIFSPRAWRAFDLKHLDLAIKSARAVKYVKNSEVKPKKPRAPRKKKGDAGPEPM